MKTINAPSLQAILATAQPPLLLHVLPPESWASQRLPHARCACVYEVTFLDTVASLASDIASHIIVYGAGEPTLEAIAAAEKLTVAGYQNITIFSGGLREWIDAGLATEGTGLAVTPPNYQGQWRIDPTASVIRWTGRNLFNHHEGTVQLSGGQFAIAGDHLENGTFAIDMTSIACTDIPDQAMNQILLQHLANADFFLSSEFPEATFSVASAKPISTATLGTPNFMIEGTLTLRGVAQPIEFPALIALNDEGQLIAQAQLEIDRTRWGISYGSGRLFAWLGKHVVNDLVALHIKIKAIC
ncbi:MAG: sulfurtransferase [Verrucomicrobia bacterium]|nr:MAG: sulfurtransferase [Verrucomicrobiota bacterium]